jgi:hypothetical protein
MSETSSTEPKPQSSENANSSPASDENVTVAFTKSQLITACAAGLAICFFLPWIEWIFGKTSGFDLAKQGGKWLPLWIIPICGAITVAAGLSKQPQRMAAQVTGTLPFVALAVFLSNNGTDLLKVMAFGGWLSLCLGLALLILPHRCK